MSEKNDGARLASTPEADRMVVSASSEAQPPAVGAISAPSPGQACSSTNGEPTDAAVEEGSAQAMLRVKGLLSCSACGVLLQHGEHQPRLLPSCLHTVCSRCAQQRSSGESPAEEGFQCGLCMTSSPTVLEHPLVEELLQREHVQQRNRFCGQCLERGNQAASAGECAECSTELCQVCIDAHQITKLTWRHSISRFDTTYANPQCPEHHKTLDNYCDTCCKVGCGDCILSSHRSHKSCTLESKGSAVKQDLQPLLANMRELRASLSQKMDVLKEKLAEAEASKESGLESIRGHCQDYQERIRLFFTGQLESAQERYDAYGRELHVLMNKASLMELRLSHLDNFAHRLMDNGRPSTLIDNAKYVLALAKKLGKVDMVCQPEGNLPKVELRRDIPIDRIGDMIGLVLYDGDVCLQPAAKAELMKSFQSVSAEILGLQVRARTDFGLMHVRMLLKELMQVPAMRPKLCKLIMDLNQKMIVADASPGQATARPTQSGEVTAPSSQVPLAPGRQQSVPSAVQSPGQLLAGVSQSRGPPPAVAAGAAVSPAIGRDQPVSGTAPPFVLNLQGRELLQLAEQLNSQQTAQTGVPEARATLSNVPEIQEGRQTQPSCMFQQQQQQPPSQQQQQRKLQQPQPQQQQLQHPQHQLQWNQEPQRQQSLWSLEQQRQQQAQRQLITQPQQQQMYSDQAREGLAQWRNQPHRTYSRVVAVRHQQPTPQQQHQQLQPMQQQRSQVQRLQQQQQFGQRPQQPIQQQHHWEQLQQQQLQRSQQPPQLHQHHQSQLQTQPQWPQQQNQRQELQQSSSLSTPPTTTSVLARLCSQPSAPLAQRGPLSFHSLLSPSVENPPPQLAAAGPTLATTAAPAARSATPEMPLSWHSPATPRPARPAGQLSLDKHFRVALGRKRMLSGDDEDTRSQGLSSPGTSTGGLSPAPDDSSKRSRKESVGDCRVPAVVPKPEPETAPAAPLLETWTAVVDGSSSAAGGNWAGPGPPLTVTTTASGSVSPLSESRLFPGSTPSQAAAAATASTPDPAASTTAATAMTEAEVAAAAAAKLMRLNNLTLTPVSASSAKEDASVQPMPITSVPQPAMVVLFEQSDKRDATASEELSLNSDESSVTTARRAAAAAVQRSHSAEEQPDLCSSSADRRRWRSGGLDRSDPPLPASDAPTKRAGTSGLSDGDSAGWPGLQGGDRSQPSPADMAAVLNKPDSAPDKSVWQSCAPRDSSSPDGDAEPFCEEELGAGEPSEQLQWSSTEISHRDRLAAPAAPLPKSSSSVPVSAPLPPDRPAEHQPVGKTPLLATAASQDDSRPAGGDRDGAGGGRRRSSGPSVERRLSSEPAADPLVPLNSQQSVSAHREELTHVVCIPESVMSGKASLSWESARDPLGICFPREMLYRPPERGPSSPNVSYCVLCWDGGDLVLCDSCERAFHSYCYVGSIGDDDESTPWQCVMCRVMPRPLSPLERRSSGVMNEQDMILACRLLTELYATYYPAMYFKSLENMSKLPEFNNIERPVCLDAIKERLVRHEFSTLMGFLRTTKKLMNQIRFFERGTPVHKYLKELDEKFEQFLQQYMNEYWLQLDDGASAK